VRKQHNVWPVYLKYRYIAYSEEDIPLAVKGTREIRNWKRNNNGTRGGITNKMSTKILKIDIGSKFKTVSTI